MYLCQNKEISSSLYSIHAELLFQFQCISSLAVAVTLQTEVRVPVVSCQATGPLLHCMQSGQSCVTAVGPPVLFLAVAAASGPPPDEPYLTQIGPCWKLELLL